MCHVGDFLATGFLIYEAKTVAPDVPSPGNSPPARKGRGAVA